MYINLLMSFQPQLPLPVRDSQAVDQLNSRGRPSLIEVEPSRSPDMPNLPPKKPLRPWRPSESDAWLWPQGFRGQGCSGSWRGLKIKGSLCAFIHASCSCIYLHPSALALGIQRLYAPHFGESTIFTAACREVHCKQGLPCYRTCSHVATESVPTYSIPGNVYWNDKHNTSRCSRVYFELSSVV